MSVIPWLFAIQLCVLFVCAARARTTSARFAVIIVALVLISWGAISAWMALTKNYQLQGFLALAPGLWLPAVPFVLVLPVFILTRVRQGFWDIANNVPRRWFIAIQALRVTAIGTLLKTIDGSFPVEVELAIGITDLAFGLSAVALLVIDARRPLSGDAFIIWHLTGIAIIVLPGELAFQSGLPGPLQVFFDPPTSAVMLDWPMVLAPSLVVPIFLMFNLLGVVVSAQRRNKTEVIQ